MTTGDGGGSFVERLDAMTRERNAKKGKPEQSDAEISVLLPTASAVLARVYNRVTDTLDAAMGNDGALPICRPIVVMQ